MRTPSHRSSWVCMRATPTTLCHASPTSTASPTSNAWAPNRKRADSYRPRAELPKTNANARADDDRVSQARAASAWWGHAWEGACVLLGGVGGRAATRRNQGLPPRLRRNPKVVRDANAWRSKGINRHT